MAKNIWYGFSGPFYANEEVLPQLADERLIKNDLMQLLMTSLGERLMRPNFGTKLRKFVFELDDPASILSLRESIISTIQREEPRVVLKSVSAVPDSDRHVLKIVITVALTLDPSRQFFIDFEL